MLNRRICGGLNLKKKRDGEGGEYRKLGRGRGDVAKRLLCNLHPFQCVNEGVKVGFQLFINLLGLAQEHFVTGRLQGTKRGEGVNARSKMKVMANPGRYLVEIGWDFGKLLAEGSHHLGIDWIGQERGSRLAFGRVLDLGVVQSYEESAPRFKKNGQLLCDLRHLFDCVAGARSNKRKAYLR